MKIRQGFVSNSSSSSFVMTFINTTNENINIQKQIEDNNSLLLKNKNDKNAKSDLKLNYQTKISTCTNN